MTPLARLLQRRIEATGPISVAEFMAEALGHPEHGYYATRDPLGAKGDFVTAPEISQMFGELVGLALAQAWIDMGRPDPVRLIELGPGRGTLMSDLMRATAGVDGFHAAADLHLVEGSPVLRRMQADRIAQPITHHDTLDTVPEGPLLLIANEFFDALPVRQFLRDGAGWRERLVGCRDDRLVFGLSDVAPLAALDHRLADTAEGDMVELCSAAEALAGEIGRRLAASGGVALIVDYGDWRSLGDTLQAVRAHRKVDPLDDPGLADLTAHVAFEPMAGAMSGVSVAPLTPQGVWLERLGITARARRLAEGLGEDRIEQLAAAHRRLTHPQEMGNLFKVFAAHAPPATRPAGV